MRTLGKAFLEMLRRFTLLFKAWFGIGLEKVENPKTLLERAKREVEKDIRRRRQ